MSFSLSSRNIRLDGAVLHAECCDSYGDWHSSKFHLDAVLGNDDGSFRWLWRDFHCSAADIRLNGAVLHAKLSPINSEPREACIDLDERICNLEGELTYHHGDCLYSRIGQTKTSNGAFAVDNDEIDAFAWEEVEKKKREKMYASATAVQRSITEEYFKALPLYEYKPLQSSRSIRLVKIKPQSVRPVLVFCSMQEFELDDAPPFAALSYTWGNPLPPGTPELDQRFREQITIACDKQRLQVGQNLYEAIRRIRSDYLKEPREKMYNKTQLICDAEDGHHLAVERLLREGADVHATDMFGNTALHYAAENGHVLIVKALVYAGSNIRAIDNSGRTPLDCAGLEESYSGPWLEIRQLLSYHLEQPTLPQRQDSCLRGQVCDLEYFWIDALCINQDDSQEKSSQVALMGEIYKKATSAVVWLGSTYDKWDDPALTLLQGVWTLEGARTNGQIEDEVLVRMLELFDKPNPYDVAIDGFDPASFAVRDWINMFDGNMLFDGWLLGPQLFHRTYFSRVWILQEVFMAKEISVVCGQYIIPWDILIFMSSFIEGMKSSFRYKRPEQRRIIGALLVAGRSEGVPALQLEKWKRLFKQRGKLPMLNALHLTRNAQSTDARDKVFSTLSFSTMSYTTGVGQKTFTPDYTADVDEVYINVGKALLEAYGTPALSHAGMRRESNNPRLPSWAPDLRIPLPAWPSGMDVDHKGLPPIVSNDGILDPTTGTLSTYSLRITLENEVQIAGIVWDTITETTAPGLNDVGSELENLSTWIDFVSTFDHPNNEVKQQVLWHTLLGHAPASSSDITDTHFRDWLIFHCCTSVFDLGDYLRTCVRQFTIPDIDDAATTTLETKLEHVKRLLDKAKTLFAALNITFTNDQDSTEPQRSLHTLFSPSTQPSLSTDTELYEVWEHMAPLAEPFGRAIQKKDPSRRLVRLKKHRGVGAAPEMARVGDVICLLHGGRVPYVLRQREGGRYALVGEAFVEGVSVGHEFLGGLLEGRVGRVRVV